MTDVVLLNNPVLKYRPDSSVPVNIEAVAQRIARLLGGVIRENGGSKGRVYHVPFAAVHSKLAAAHGITGFGNLYGGIVRRHEHADKAILHSLPSKNASRPEWYSPHFASSVQNAVLPGYTVFTHDDAAHAYNLMRADGFTIVRLKDPTNTGGLGQHLIQSSEELARTLTGYTDKLSKTGVLLEPDLHGAVTITIGCVNIDGVVCTWHGRPYDVNHNGMMRFGGNELTVVRGDLEVLLKHTTDPNDRLAIKQAMRVYGAYSLLDSNISRATLDAVQGVACDGTFLSGITDPSLRPSASSAAEIRAIEALVANPRATVVKTRLQYDYEKITARRPTQELFVSHPRMDILVELVSVS